MSVYYDENNRHKELYTADNVMECKNTNDDKIQGGLLASIDRDTLLTAAVLLLMLKNGGDMRLILALGYIMLGGKNESGGEK